MRQAALGALDELTDALAQAYSYCALHQRLGARAEHPFSPRADVLLNAGMALNLTLYAEALSNPQINDNPQQKDFHPS